MTLQYFPESRQQHSFNTPITLDFTGKLVLVTGGGRGIGLSIYKALAEAGADAAISYTSKDATCKLNSGASIGILLWKSLMRTLMACASNCVYTDFIADSVCLRGLSIIFAVNTFGSYYLSRALTRSWLSLPVSVNSASDPIDIANMRDVDLKEQILFASSTSALVAMSPQEQSAYNASKIPGTLLNLPLLGLISVRWLVTCKY